MGKIRSAGTPGGAIGALFNYLRRLHRLAGEPSTREIARNMGTGMISHATVHTTLRGPRVPRWPVLELVVEQLGGDVKQAKELWLSARDSEDDRTAARPLAIKPHSYLEAAGFTTATVRVTPSEHDGDLVVEVENNGASRALVINSADRLAMAALFAGYLRRPPAYDPNPSSYRAAASRLGWPRTTLIKRIEYLRTRLAAAGVPLMGLYALHSLAEFAIAYRLITKDDLD